MSITYRSFFNFGVQIDLHCILVYIASSGYTEITINFDYQNKNYYQTAVLHTYKLQFTLLKIKIK